MNQVAKLFLFGLTGFFLLVFIYEARQNNPVESKLRNIAEEVRVENPALSLILFATLGSMHSKTLPELAYVVQGFAEYEVERLEKELEVME